MTIKDEIRVLAAKYASELKANIDARVQEMKADDTSHYLIYRVLGITDKEGELIDVYQNKGRFLYKYAGSFLEEAAKLCFKQKFPNSCSVRIPNTEGKRPKTFEIDCVVGTNALEIIDLRINNGKDIIYATAIQTHRYKPKEAVENVEDVELRNEAFV